MLKSLAKDSAIVAGFLTLWLLFQLLDPFSSESATRSASHQFFSAVSAPFYGMSSRPARQQIAVVEITDSTIGHENLNHAWPLPYSTLALYLDEILDAAPKAVFVDIVFAHEQSGQSLHEFDGVLKKARDRRIPILFARGGRDDVLPQPLDDVGTIVRWTADPGFYPLVVSPESGKDGPPLPTASLDLYDRLCAARQLHDCDPRIMTQAIDHPMYVHWGDTIPPDQSRVSRTAGCLHSKAVSLGMLWHAISLTVANLLPGLDLHAQQSCFYELSISAEELPRDDGTGRPIVTLLANRVVFFGADLIGDHDVVPASPYGMVSGTQLHAMAFDNLLTYGAGYFAKPSEWVVAHRIKLPATLLFGLVAWLLGLLMLCFGRTSGTMPRLVLLCLVALAIVVDLSQRWLHQSLLGWPIVVGLYGVLTAVALAAWTYHPPLRPVTRLDRWIRAILIHARIAKFARIATLIAGLTIFNDLILRWPTSDWFGMALLFLTIGEARQAEASEEETRLVDQASAAFRRLAKRPKEARNESTVRACLHHPAP